MLPHVQPNLKRNNRYETNQTTSRAKSQALKCHSIPTSRQRKSAFKKAVSFLCTDQYCTRDMVGTRGKCEVNSATNPLASAARKRHDRSRHDGDQQNSPNRLCAPALCALPASAQAPARDMKELKPRVFVVDDDQAVRTRLANLLATQDYAVEIFVNAAEYLARVPYPGPACTVLEVQLPGFDGLALQRQLTEEGRMEQIVFITRHGDVSMGISAMKRGAVDFLPKPFRDDELLSAVAQALARSATVAEARARLAKLTPREFEVFRLVIAGLLNKEIGAELGVTLRTIKEHRARVMQKIGVVSVVELVRLALKADVTPAPHGRKVHEDKGLFGQCGSGFVL